MIYILSLNDWDGSIDIVASKDLKKIRKYNAELLLEIRKLKKEIKLIKSKLIKTDKIKNSEKCEEEINKIIDKYDKLKQIEFIDILSPELVFDFCFSITEINEI